jgi:hypothetical protein
MQGRKKRPFGAQVQTTSIGRKSENVPVNHLKKAFPPIRSNGEWGATSGWDYPIINTSCFLKLPFLRNETWKLSLCQSLKHQVHAGFNSCGSS